MVWGCKGNQKRCRDVVFDHDEFLGKHQWHWTRSWAGVWDHPLSVERSLTLGRDLLCEVWVCCPWVKSFLDAECRRKQWLLTKADDQAGHKWSSCAWDRKLLKEHPMSIRSHFLVNDLLCWNWTEMCSTERTIPLSCPHLEATQSHSQWLLWTEKAPLQPGQIFLCYSHVLSIRRGSRHFPSDSFFLRSAEGGDFGVPVSPPETFRLATDSGYWMVPSLLTLVLLDATEEWEPELCFVAISSSYHISWHGK